MVCERKRINQIKLCTGDLKHLVALQERSLDESGFDTVQPVETFTTVWDPWVAIETLGSGINRGSRIFKGVNIDPNATHIFWLIYSPAIPKIETANNFFLFNNTRYRVLEATNINELNQAIAVQVTNRGEESAEATKA